jgi:hypothetical protein
MEIPDSRKQNALLGSSTYGPFMFERLTRDITASAV